MKVSLQEITIREITKNFIDNSENGVIGYDGKLDIRPKYQREFVYKDAQRNAVINTVMKSYPLNVMYWVRKDDGTYELLDGQQRTLSICSYIAGDFSLDFKYFHNLEQDQKDQILDYKLMVYICEGGDSEKLDWFKTINIAGEKLTEQELRNAVYTGTWLSDAKRYFSKTSGPAHGLGSDYMKGVANRQEYLETALRWISNNNIEEYMAVHQHDANAFELWTYFQNVITWTSTVFSEYRKEMKGVDFGTLYNEFKDQAFDSAVIEAEISKLMQDEDVTKKSGIYMFILTRKEKWLSIRAFTPKQKREAFESQKGVCSCCNSEFSLNEMEADHITPWSEGGTSTIDNLQMLCKACNRTKSNK